MEEFSKLTKLAGQLKKKLTKRRDKYRGLLLYQLDGSDICRLKIRKSMSQLMPLVARISELYVINCPEMWTGKEADVLQTMRSFYGISDKDLYTFDLIYVST